jgi:hypothetical protein
MFTRKPLQCKRQSKYMVDEPHSSCWSRVLPICVYGGYQGIDWMWIPQRRNPVRGRGVLMRKPYLFSLLMLCGSVAACCQDCGIDSAASFTDVKSAVLRFTTEHMFTGWDEKIWNRSGDVAAVAIVKTIPDAQMTSPSTLRDVLFILPRHGLARPAALSRRVTNSQSHGDVARTPTRHH